MDETEYTFAEAVKPALIITVVVVGGYYVSSVVRAKIAYRRYQKTRKSMAI